MITDETKFVQIKESKGFFTNVDDRDLSEDFFLRVRGLLNATPGKIVQRDFGCKHRYAPGVYPVTNLTPSTVTLIGNSSLNDATDNLEYDVIAGLDNNNKLHLWAWDGAAFSEVTRIFTATITGAITDGAGATINLTAIQENGISASLPTGSFPANMEGWVAVNAAPSGGGTVAGSSGIIRSGTASSIVLSGINPGATGMNWLAGDALILYRSGGLYNASFLNNVGVTPQLSWIPNDTQRKMTLNYGGSTTPVQGQIPLIIMRRPQRSYLFTGATPGTANLNLPATPATSWYAESGGGLCNYEAVFGSRKNVKVQTDGQFNTASAIAPDTTNYPVNAWLNIKVDTETVYGATPPAFSYAFVYVTIGYDTYEESDPVLKFFGGTVAHAGLLDVRLIFSFNPALMPKNVTEIRVYRYSVNLDAIGTPAIQAFLGSIGDDQILLQRTYHMQSFPWPGYSNSNTLTPNDPAGRWMSFTYDSLDTINNPPETSDSVASNLAHTVVHNRKILTPRYAARATKQQGAVVVVDQDDTTLRVSSYDGGGAHEDDNFPGDSTDRNGSPLIVFLTSFGELLGLSINNDMIVALKRNAVEFSDFQATQGQQVIHADVIAKRSIVQTPYGLVWAGASAIYMLPSDGSEIKVLNQGWKNWYDGTLLTTNATPTPFLTLAQKQGIFSGYDPTYNAYWAVMTVQTEDGSTTEQLIGRYYFEGIDSEGKAAARWDMRQLGGFSASWLSRRKDTITIGQNSGILFYPNNLGVGNFKDNVSSTDTGGTGVPTKALINMGSLHSLSVQNVFTGIKFDIKALGTGVFRSRFYINDLTTATEDKANKISEHPHVRELPPWGSVRRLRVEIELTADVGNISQFDINTLEMRYIPRPAVGAGSS